MNPLDDPQTVAAAQAAIGWESDRAFALAQLRQAAADKRDAEVQRAEQELEAERRRVPDPDFAAFGHRITGRPALTPAEAIAKHMLMAPAEADARDPGAPYGSPSRPEVLVSTPGGLVALQARESVQRSAPSPGAAALRRQQGRDWMLAEVERLERRRAGRAEGEAELARLNGGGWHDAEICR